MTIVRLHDKPIKLRQGVLTETAANTYTERQDDVPVRSAGRGKIQALEIMKSAWRVSIPSLEPGESNTVNFHVSSETKGGITQTADDEDIFLAEEVGVRSEEAADVTLSAINFATEIQFDHSDGDGNGQLWFSRDLFLGVAGVGNAGARSVRGFFLYYLVEVDGDDIIQQILNQ